MILKCKTCLINFKSPRRSREFCSRKCQSLSLRKFAEKKCLFCRKAYVTWPCMKNSKFCSHDCYFKNLKGKPTWNKGLKGWNDGHLVSQETRKKISESHRGNKSCNWKGGLSPLITRIRHELFEMKKWIKDCLERDIYSCQDCGQVGGNLNVHHKRYFHLIMKDFLNEYNQFSPIEDKETLERLSISYKPFWDLNNGITLCVKCHLRAHNGVHNPKAVRS